MRLQKNHLNYGFINKVASFSQRCDFPPAWRVPGGFPMDIKEAFRYHYQKHLSSNHSQSDGTMSGLNPYIEQAEYTLPQKPYRVTFLPEGKVVEVHPG